MNKIVICIAVLLSLSACCKLDKGLVLYSDFEEDARDLSKLCRNGRMKGAVLSDDAAVGKHSVYFDGIDDYVEYPEGIYFEGAYSISIWAKWEECGLWNRIMDFNQDSPMSGNAVTLLVGPSEKGMIGRDLWFDQWIQVDGSPVESIIDQFARPGEASLSYKPEIGVWKHIVIVYNPDENNSLGEMVNRKGQKVPYEGKVSLYLDGDLWSESYRCLKPQSVSTLSNWLGRSRFAADPYFQGKLDEFRLYDRCLNEKEIKKLFKQSKKK